MIDVPRCDMQASLQRRTLCLINGCSNRTVCSCLAMESKPNKVCESKARIDNVLPDM
nr:MAG TPA: hypothetical protein [Caudoviricetes sp.]